MIAFLRGTVATALPNCIILDVNGVGYKVLIPLSSYDALNPVPGMQLTLLTHLVVREDAHILYGFANEAERDIFNLLINHVSGIGPTIAMSTLSGMSVEAFKQAVISNDATSLSRVKGLGKKTAERIILELKDKLGVAANWQHSQNNPGQSHANDAELALLALGYNQKDCKKVIQAILLKQPDLGTDQIIRLALRGMS